MRPLHKFNALLLILALQGCWRHKPNPELAAILTAPKQGSFDDTLIHPGEDRITHILPLTLGKGHAAHPSLNLDGTQIAFEAIGEGLNCTQIFVMDADRYNTRLVSTGAGEALHPSFSPSGTQVLYQSTHTSSPSCQRDAPQTLSELSIYPAAYDLFLTNLTAPSARAVLNAPGFQGLASFSPRGDRVVYTQQEEETTAIYVVELHDEEGTPTRLNFAIHTPGEPRFNAQGTRLVLTGSPDPKQPFIRELFVWDFERASLTQITHDGVQHGEPIFHPDGQQILYSSNIDASAEHPGRQIYMINIDGTHLEQITFGPGISSSPSLSGNGTRLVFSSTRSLQGEPGTSGIFIADFLMAARARPRLRGQAAIEIDTIRPRVVALSSEAMQGREAGSPGEQRARDYLIAQFEFVGLQPSPALAGTYTQEFSFERPEKVTTISPEGVEVASVKNTPVTSANIVGWLPAREDARPTELTLVIGAHYDHAGFGNDWLSARAEHHGQLHPGADDNASGVSAMLELAEALRDSPRQHDILFVAFGAEEYGLIGSTHFVQSGIISPDRTIAMINLDMVGRLDAQPLLIRGDFSSPAFRDLIRRHQPIAQIDVAFQPALQGNSDFLPFFHQKIPILGFFTGMHDDYHSPGDTEDRIDYEGLSGVTTLAYLIAAELANSARQPSFYTTASGVKLNLNTPRQEDGVRDYQKAPYLGSVPGRSPEGSPAGVYLRAVQPGSPAALAGLRAGDVLTMFDARAIEDLRGFAEALMMYKGGDVVRITFVRDGESKRVEVTLDEPTQP